MKVIIRHYKFVSAKSSSPLHIWDPNGGCYEGPGCEGCYLDGRDCHITINAFVLYLITSNKIVIPCTINTDDYPELFI